MRNLTWLLPLLLCLAGCSQFQLRPKPTLVEASTADEYAVYASVLQSNWPGQAQIVIMDTTDIHMLTDIESQIDGNLPALEKGTLSQFLLVNKQGYALANHFQIDSRVVLISQSESNAIFDQNLDEGWLRFFKKYPTAQGLLSLSRVGFNAQKNQALVYFGNQKGSLDGAGYIVLLAYENNSWVLIKQLMIWIS